MNATRESQGPYPASVWIVLMPGAAVAGGQPMNRFLPAGALTPMLGILMSG